MSRTLPTKPSLSQLKHQAKDLVKAHSRGDTTVCDTLRVMRDFAKASDDEILSAKLTLSRAQFALALVYGFASWDTLKEHVESREKEGDIGLPKDELDSVTKADLGKLIEEWWKTHATHRGGNDYEWDDEIRAVNALTPPAESLPDWAVKVRSAMPRYGFELCSHRWLEGLEHVLRMIGDERPYPSTAGHCGDVPDEIIDAAMERADAVARWLDGTTASDDPLQGDVATRLGPPDAEKEEAARCFVELVRSFLTESRPCQNALALTKRWRGKSKNNGVIQQMLVGEGLHGLLQNRCGFKFIDRLDIYIQMIGGDMSRADDRHGVCVDQCRFTYPDDPARYETTRGYLWGLYAYLTGRDGKWLESHRPECADAAIHALNGVSRAGEPSPLRRWLVASFLKSAKLWIAHAVPRDRIPSNVRELPDVLEALEA